MSGMNEAQIEAFWDAHPCGEQLVGGKEADFQSFFDRYDAYRYATEGHILGCLDEMYVDGQSLLEIGLGQGADSEQLIKRGAKWHGLDLTAEAVARVKTRMEIKQLAYEDVKQGSILQAPYEDNQFDVIFSHGVLHHVPDILEAQVEIKRMLKPGGRLVVMLYARRSLNYLLSIAVLRRLGLLALYYTGANPGGIYAQHLKNAKEQGIWDYLQLENFTHYNTDGPLNPHARVYDLADVRRDFPDFTIEYSHKEFMHAPPLPVQGWPGASAMGWHLWVHMRVKE